MKLKFTLLLFINIVLFPHVFAQSDLIITAVFDGPLSGGTPKGIELYVANDIADLSQYGIGSANNGEGTDGKEFTFPAVSATAGDFIYVASESTYFTTFFGFAPDYTNDVALINGFDAIELFQGETVVDIFGDITYNSGTESNLDWAYQDSWAYRLSGSGPDGSTFSGSSWHFPGSDALDGESTNASSITPVPIGSFTTTAVPTVYVSPGEITEIDSSTITGSPVVQTVKVTGANLSDDITVSLNETGNFLISADGTTFSSSSISLTQSSGNVETLVYVKLQSNLAKGAYSSSLTLSSTGVTDITLDCSGEVYFYTQKFVKTLGDFTTYNVSGTQTWKREADGNPAGSAKMSGFLNDDWLISPSLDLSDLTNGILSFETVKYASPKPLQVMVSADYVSGAPSTATWYDVSSLFDFPTSDGWTPWHSSGEADISGISGSNIHFAFRYVSTNVTSGTWEVDNIIISEAATARSNEAPVVNSVTVDPSAPAAGQTITITGDASDTDGSITHAIINWGTAVDALTNTIVMEVDETDLSAVSVIAAQSAGTVIYYEVVVMDNGGATATSGVESLNIAYSQTIQEIQGETETSPFAGYLVQTTGTVTRVVSGGFYMQNGTGDWSGIYVDVTSSVTEGDVVSATGTVEEYNGQTRISGDVTVEVTGSGTVPDAAIIYGAVEEKDESVLMEMAYAVMESSAQDANGVLTLNIGSNRELDVFVDDLYYDFTSPQADYYYSIVGIIHHDNTLSAYPYRFAPGFSWDIVEHSSIYTGVETTSSTLKIYGKDLSVVLENATGSIQVYNLAGKQVYSGNAHGGLTQISVPSKGIFMVRVQNESSTQIQKVSIR